MFHLAAVNQTLPMGVIHQVHRVRIVQWFCSDTDCRRVVTTWEKDD